MNDITALIDKARKAQALWEEVPYRERCRRLGNAGRYLAARIDGITETIHRDNGKLPIDALAAEVLPAILALNYYLKQGKGFLKDRKISGGSLLMSNKRSRMIYKPYGVVGIISPWNYPFSIPFSEVVMALLAGNAVLLKTASAVPKIGQALEDIFSGAELPEGLFSRVELPGPEAGRAFISDPSGGVDKLFFTGSTAVGRELMALAAPRLLPLVLELGGADAAIIREDADLDRAVAGIIWSGFSNAGQSCGGVQRVILHRKVYEPFLEKLCALTGSLVPGKDLGPMTTAKQKETVRKQVEACLTLGARIAAQSPGASLEDGSLSAPALVLTNLTADMPVMNEEIFGPVVAVIPASDDGEALRIANASSYGLTGSVWSRSSRRARELARRINAGAVMINDHLMSHGLAETPWGGFGDSGLGRTHGELGFREMLKAQVIIDDILPGVKRNLWWQPYSEEIYRGIRAITEFLTGTTGGRIRALPALIRIFFRYWGK
ncbi:MAG: aldehyde dehydrogenase family protein [Treponema sp.]|jgi:succinate-semialdehyde dehydrogenase/glutarate-semialdehyde dehydrogenase|nr:aldehyde dehydrogenase family protein [Treponema sp.]